MSAAESGLAGVASLHQAGPRLTCTGGRWQASMSV